MRYFKNGLRFAVAAASAAGLIMLAGATSRPAPTEVEPWGLTDSDLDGIPDVSEVFGYSTSKGTIDFPGLGADPYHKDIFLEIDVMSGITVPAGAFDDVVDAFHEAPVLSPDGGAGINLHIDSSGSVPYFDEVDFGDHGGNRKAAALAANASGQVAVAWADDEDLNGFYEIKARRFDAAGNALTSQLNVNTVSSGQQTVPDVAQNALGDTAVVWQDDSDGNGFYQIKGRLFDANGTALTGQLTINAVSDGQQSTPSVGIDSAGNWLVAWQDDSDGNGFYEIRARKFSRAGVALTGDISVNSESSGQQRDPDVAVAADGSAVVTWSDDRDDNGFYEIFARRVSSAGAATGGDIHVNDTSDGQQACSSVGIASSGDFVVAWQDDSDGNDFYQIHARRFLASGSANGGDFVVNTTSDGQQSAPSVAMSSGGAFMVGWQDDRDGNGYYQVYARAYRSDGTARTGEVRVNSVSTDQQQFPSAGMDDNGAFVAAYQDDRDKNDLWKVYFRGFDADGTAVTADTIAHLDTASYATLKDKYFTDVREGFYHYCILANRRVNTGSSGIANNLGDDLIVSLGLNPSRAMLAGTVMHELGHNLNLKHGGNENKNYKPNYMSVMNYQYQFFGADQNCNASSSAADPGALDYSKGRKFPLVESALDERIGICNGNIDVNHVSEGQQTDPDVGVSGTGDFAVAWEDDRDGNGFYEIVARFYPANYPASLPSSEIRVNPDSSGQQRNPAVGVADSGNFIVAWEDDRDGNGYTEIFARRFDGGGVSPASEFRVNSNSDGNQKNPAIAVAGDGILAAVWEDDSNDNGVYQIHARLFSSIGVALTGDVVANSVSDGNQRYPRVAIADDHSFVVVWEDDSDGNGYYEIRARRFSTIGAALGSNIVVNQDSDGQQRRPDVAVAGDGRFVVVWEDDSDGNGFYEIKGRRFDASGSASGSQFTVNTESDGQQRYPRVSASGGFEFAVVWQDDQDDNGFYQIVARAYQSNGTARTSNVTMNVESDGQQTVPDVAMDDSGQFYLAWQDDHDKNGLYEIDGTRATNAGARRDATPINWDGDGNGTEGSVSVDINGDGSRNTVKDFDDWAHVKLNF